MNTREEKQPNLFERTFFSFTLAYEQSLPLTPTRTVQLADRAVAYSIHASGRARRLSLRLTPQSGLVFVVPKRWRADAIDFDALLNARMRWIFRALDRVARCEHGARKLSFTGGSKLSVLGRETTLKILPGVKERTVVRMIGDELQVHTSNAEPDHIRTAVVAWLKSAARRVIPERVKDINRRAGFAFKNIIVRDQRTRWGSCSRRGTLSFNWRLLLVPTSVMEYLIYHELAHLQEMNHSARFWGLVQELCPTFRESERWLKSNGRTMLW